MKFPHQKHSGFTPLLESPAALPQPVSVDSESHSTRGLKPHGQPRKRPCLQRGQVTGFTLVEILTVVSIIGILSVGGFFAYKKFTDRARTIVTTANMNKFAETINLIKAQSGMGLYQIFNYGCTPGVNCGSHSADDYSCRNKSLIKGDPSGAYDSCMATWESLLSLIAAEGARVGIFNSSDKLDCTNGQSCVFDAYRNDAWGSPYLMDANEGEDYPPGSGDFSTRPPVCTATPYMTCNTIQQIINCKNAGGSCNSPIVSSGWGWGSACTPDFFKSAGPDRKYFNNNDLQDKGGLFRIKDFKRDAGPTHSVDCTGGENACSQLAWNDFSCE